MFITNNEKNVINERIVRCFDKIDDNKRNIDSIITILTKIKKEFIVNVNDNLNELSTKIKQLECDHKNTKLTEELLKGRFDQEFKKYSIICEDCGKELQRLSYIDYLQEKINRNEKENNDLEKEIHRVEESKKKSRMK